MLLGHLLAWPFYKKMTTYALYLIFLMVTNVENLGIFWI